MDDDAEDADDDDMPADDDDMPNLIERGPTHLANIVEDDANDADDMPDLIERPDNAEDNEIEMAEAAIDEDVDTTMDERYGERNAAYNLRPRKPRD